MRTTIELPDELLLLAKSRAALAGISLREFFVDAVQQKLETAKPKKIRRPLPSIGTGNGPKIGPFTSEEIDEAIFG